METAGGPAPLDDPLAKCDRAGEETQLKLLDERDALTEIRALFKTSGVARLAVAFWGSGAIERLGLGRSGLSAQVLCNLDSGACNPTEVRKMRDLLGSNLRSHPSLHAKVYWTPNGAVLGSSNASANGLALEGDAACGWAEANVRLSDSSVLQEIADWFEKQFALGNEVSDADLDRAEQLWRARAKMAPSGRRHTGDLLSTFQSAPEHAAWNQIKLAYWRDPLSPADEAWLATQRARSGLSATVSAYARWDKKIGADDWVLDFDLSGSTPLFTGLWKALPGEAGRAGLQLVCKVRKLLLPGLGHLSFSFDGAPFAAIAAVVLSRFSDEGGRNALIDLPTAMGLVAEAQVTPNEQTFTRAMRQIYSDAVAIGYRPTTFQRMLADHGGIETARRLIRGSGATSGFTVLWEKNRLDLSVEALILKPEWRLLFSPDEQKIAQKRLRDFGYAPDS